jgi:hypothetical protein
MPSNGALLTGGADAGVLAGGATLADGVAPLHAAAMIAALPSNAASLSGRLDERVML